MYRRAQQPTPGRDHERPAEGIRIRELAAKIETAHEAEDFAERRAAVREPRGQRTRLTLEQQLRASPGAARGGEQEHRQHFTVPCTGELSSPRPGVITNARPKAFAYASLPRK